MLSMKPDLYWREGNQRKQSIYSGSWPGQKLKWRNINIYPLPLFLAYSAEKILNEEGKWLSSWYIGKLQKRTRNEGCRRAACQPIEITNEEMKKSKMWREKRKQSMTAYLENERPRSIGGGMTSSKAESAIEEIWLGEETESRRKWQSK